MFNKFEMKEEEKKLRSIEQKNTFEQWQNDNKTTRKKKKSKKNKTLWMRNEW